MSNCCTGSDFEQSPLFYVSRRNTQQRDSITTHPTSTCCYQSLCHLFLLLTQKIGDFLKSVPVWQLGIYPKWPSILWYWHILVDTRTLDHLDSWMGSTIGFFTELCFLNFSVAQPHRCLWGCESNLLKNFVFHTLACAAGFNNSFQWCVY